MGAMGAKGTITLYLNGSVLHCELAIHVICIARALSLAQLL
jgi:hypothetical protein